MNRVLCDAMVDRISESDFFVTVLGAGEHNGIVKEYTISSPDDDRAAREGIDRFIREMGGDA